MMIRRKMKIKIIRRRRTKFLTTKKRSLRRKRKRKENQCPKQTSTRKSSPSFCPMMLTTPGERVTCTLTPPVKRTVTVMRLGKMSRMTSMTMRILAVSILTSGESWTLTPRGRRRPRRGWRSATWTGTGWVPRTSTSCSPPSAPRQGASPMSKYSSQVCLNTFYYRTPFMISFQF